MDLCEHKQNKGKCLGVCVCSRINMAREGERPSEGGREREKEREREGVCVCVCVRGSTYTLTYSCTHILRRVEGDACLFVCESVTSRSEQKVIIVVWGCRQ